MILYHNLIAHQDPDEDMSDEEEEQVLTLQSLKPALCKPLAIKVMEVSEYSVFSYMLLLRIWCLDTRQYTRRCIYLMIHDRASAVT